MKLTPQDIERKVVEKKFFYWDTFTICALELENGFKVCGTSGCADPVEYNRELGEELAYKKAIDQIWMLEGYMLRNILHVFDEHPRLSPPPVPTALFGDPNVKTTE